MKSIAQKLKDRAFRGSNFISARVWNIVRKALYRQKIDEEMKNIIHKRLKNEKR